MSKFTPKKMILLGTGLMLLGVIFPLLMVVKVIEPTLWLSFLSHGCSVIGVFLGFYGVFSYVRIERK
jgi:hypothetical protein